MDGTLSTSVILVVAVALWLVWVGPYVMRSRRPRLSTFGAGMPLPGLGSAAKQSSVLLRERSAPSDGGPLQKPSATTTSTSQVKESAIAAKPAALKIRYGRTAVAGVGLLALLTALVSGILAMAGVARIAVPLLAMLVFVASLALLRMLAVRDRRTRVQEAFRAAMGSGPARPVGRPHDTSDQFHTTTPAPRTAPRRPSGEVFDGDGATSGAARSTPGAGEAGTAESTTSCAATPASRPLTAVELRRAALEVASRAGEPGEPWQPVDVPKPGYVQAAKAHRPSPAPLNLPQSPKPTVKTSIRAAEAGIPATGSMTRTGAGAPAPTAVSVQESPRPTSGLGNLDDVLQRRRA